MTPQRPTSRRGFTLTELMISVVLVLVLTLAVGLIFETTSSTIAKGTALQVATRNADAVRTALTRDFTGEAGIEFDALTTRNGALPLSEQPAIVITNMYVPTWKNAAEAEAEGVNWRGLTSTTQWQNNALLVDTNGDGNRNLNLGGFASPLTGPLNVGRRTFRVDQFTMTSRGRFETQAGLVGGPQTIDLEADAAMILYGHLRVFNNNYAFVDLSNGYGSPADPTSTTSRNINNLFADQFMLGRFAMPMVDFNRFFPPTGTNPIGPANYGVVTPTNQPLPFAQRNWVNTRDNTDVLSGPMPNRRRGDAMRPFDVASLGRRVSDANDGIVPALSQTGQDILLNHGALDVLPVTPQLLRERLAFLTRTLTPRPAPANTNPLVTAPANHPADIPFLQEYRERAPFAPTSGSTVLDPVGRKPAALDPSKSGPGIPERINGEAWWAAWFITNNMRPWINPLGQQPFDASTLGRRFHLLLPGAHNFIVEYAGDYLRQDPVTGEITGIGPDGEIDFGIGQNGERFIRFYGMPRDADGDGDIELYQGDVAQGTPGNGVITFGPAEEPAEKPAEEGVYTSPDVFPLKDMVGWTDAARNVPDLGHGVTNPVPFPHEKQFPLAGRRLAYNVSATTTPGGYNAGRYVAAWGPAELDGRFTTDGYTNFDFSFPLGPKLIRFVITAADPDGRLENPVTSEFVFPLQP